MSDIERFTEYPSGRRLVHEADYDQLKLERDYLERTLTATRESLDRHGHALERAQLDASEWKSTADRLMDEVRLLKERTDELATLLEGARTGKPDLREMERALAKYYGEWIK